MSQTKCELVETRAQGDIRLGDSDSSNYVALKAPATVGSNVTWTLPATDGTANYLLKTDGSGTLSWAADSTTDSTKLPLAGGTLTGDVLIDNQKELRFGEPDAAGSEYVGFEAPNTIAASVIWKLPNADGSSGQALVTDASGNLSFATVSANPAGSTTQFQYNSSGSFAGIAALTTDGTDITFVGSAANAVWDASDSCISFADNARIKFGTGLDLVIDHDGTDSKFTNTTGKMRYSGGISQNATAMGALDLNLSTSNYFTKTINANSTFTFSNPAASGQSSVFVLSLTHTSGTITWPGSVVWPDATAPTLTTNRNHVFIFETTDAGTTYRGAVLKNYTT